MQTTITIILAFALGLIAGYFIWKQRKKSRNNAQDKKKQQNMTTVLDYAQKHKRLSNDVVQSITGVSDATATNYLSQLEQQGKLKQIGSGKHTYYQLVE